MGSCSRRLYSSKDTQHTIRVLAVLSRVAGIVLSPLLSRRSFFAEAEQAAAQSVSHFT